MCGIFGIVSGREPLPLAPLLKANAERGRDSYGYTIQRRGKAPRATRALGPWDSKAPAAFCPTDATAVGNLRAEPTTEWVRSKTLSDVQPFSAVGSAGRYSIVHNGTIANDAELFDRLVDRGHIRSILPTRIDSWKIAAVIASGMASTGSLHSVLKGSYAVIVQAEADPSSLEFTTNYRPLYRVWTEPYNGQALSSVPLSSMDELLPSYVSGRLYASGDLLFEQWRDVPPRERALAIISGGLDSTVAAHWAALAGHEVELLHFDYGCRATHQERRAVEDVAERLGLPLHVLTTDLFTKTIRGSNLTRTSNAPIAEGGAGAEYASEWVPARNLVMLAIATAYAESHGFTRLVLGANLEEAGAYPDNEPEFLRQFNKLLPYAVGDGKRLQVLTPVGNMMKHEIVKLGLSQGSPMELTWSCYNEGDRHCGNCGPCFMRATAFEMNGAVDPVFVR